MQVSGVQVQTVLIVALILQVGASTTERVRFCGGSLSQAVSMVCRSFNSPSWDQGGRPARNRVRREAGIADECCTVGCTWTDLRLYCAVDEPSFPSFGAAAVADGAVPKSEELEHVIADRSAEGVVASEALDVVPPRFDARFGHSEVGALAWRAGRRRAGHGRRGSGGCWCRRRRRAGRRRATGILNMMRDRGVSRSAPVVGTVSPLLVWGRSIQTDQPSRERLRYVTV